MPFYLTLKSLPELRGRTRNERRQAMSQVGLAPYRSWQTWRALALASLALLWMAETVLGNWLWNDATSAWNLVSAAWIAGPAYVGSFAALLFRNSYLKALRPALARVSFDPDARGWRSTGKGVLKGLAAIPLALVFMALIDWAINSFDESPSPRIAEVRNWPQAIAPEGNGFIAFAGLQAAPGASPFAAGRAWIATADKAAGGRPPEYPKALADLQFVQFDTIRGTVPPAPRALPDSRVSGIQFCRPGKESCARIVHADPERMRAWLAANQELLTRYQSLYHYPGWQHATSPGLIVIPSYSPLFRGQSLLHATALLAAEQNNMGYAIELLGRDMRFARTMLAGQNPLIGKMIAAALLSNDLAIVTELLRDRPGALAPYWHDLDLMLEPLEPGMVSAADTFRFEEKWFLTVLENDSGELARYDIDDAVWSNAWIRHHFKPVSLANLQLGVLDPVIRRAELTDTSATPLIKGDDAMDTGNMARLFGFMHNQAGKWLMLASPTDYLSYANKLIELNALNNFVHLRVALAKDRVPLQDIPAYLDHSPSGLRNPETGKAFGWDAEQRQIYFTPGTRSSLPEFPRDAAGRIVFTLPGA